MKHFRFLASKWYVVLPLALILALQSCSKDVVASRAFSGEELFKGVFFGIGEVSEKITEFNTNFSSFTTNPEDLQAIARVQEEIVASITSKHPEFWASFKRDVESGNVSKVKKSVELGSKYVSEALNLDLKNLKSQANLEQLKELETELIKDKSTSLKNKLSRLDNKYKTLLKSMYQPSSRQVEAPKDGGSNIENSPTLVETPTLVESEPPASLNVNVSAQTNYYIYVYIAAVVGAIIVVVVVLGATDPEPVGGVITSNKDKDTLLREEMFASIATNLQAN